jgi:hypothetical protein
MNQGSDRREFLKGMATLSIAAAAARQGVAAAADEPRLPQIPFGKAKISRLVCGSNPFHAGSHLSVFVNKAMREYYTPEQIIKTMHRCEASGINCWQISGVSMLELVDKLHAEGSKMQIICLGSKPEDLATLAKAGCLGVAHHGELTDRLFKTGKLDQVNEYLKRVRDSGMQVGVSTHMPAVVDAIESKGWDLDYYMTCVYERHRSAEDLKKLLGYVPIPVNEVYLQEDPPRMFAEVQKTKRTCLAFKILAAGRLSEHQGWVERAFRQTFQSIKPGDGAIVGLYDRYSDQPGEDAEYTKRFGSKTS